MKGRLCLVAMAGAVDLGCYLGTGLQSTLCGQALARGVIEDVPYSDKRGPCVGDKVTPAPYGMRIVLPIV